MIRPSVRTRLAFVGMGAMQSIIVLSVLMAVSVGSRFVWLALALSVAFASWLLSRSYNVRVVLMDDVLVARNPLRTYRALPSDVVPGLRPNQLARVPVLGLRCSLAGRRRMRTSEIRLAGTADYSGNRWPDDSASINEWLAARTSTSS